MSRSSSNVGLVGGVRPNAESTGEKGSSRPRARDTAFGSPSRPLRGSEDAQRRLGLVRHHLGTPGGPEHELRPHLTEAVDRREERAHLVLDQRAARATHRRQAVLYVDVAVFLQVDLVDEPKVDDVDPELRVVDLHQRLPDAVLGHGLGTRLCWWCVRLRLDVVCHAASRRPSGICLVPAYANRRERTTWVLSARSSWTTTRSRGKVCARRSSSPTTSSSWSARRRPARRPSNRRAR